MTKTYYYFEACGFVSEPFQAADLGAAEAHVMATFRSPSNPDNAQRLADAIDAVTGESPPTPGGP